MNVLTEETALDKLSAWCSGSEHCESEAVDKLIKWGIEPDARQRIIARLKEHRFLDEERYCTAFVNDKFRFQKWGRKKIAEALRMKKVDRKMIENALVAIDADEYAETLRGLLKSKDRSLHEEDAYKRKSKLYRFAISRGFEPGVINQFIHLDEIPEMD